MIGPLRNGQDDAGGAVADDFSAADSGGIAGDDAALLGVGTTAARRELARDAPGAHPHHSNSIPVPVGGGTIPNTGKMSLAYHGVLFLNEVPEFTR